MLHDEPIPISIANGITNRFLEERLPEGFVADAVDVDYDDTGHVSSRGDTTKVHTLTVPQGVFANADIFLVAANGRLYTYDPDNDLLTTLATGIGNGNVCFAELPQSVLWSTPEQIGQVREGKNSPLPVSPPAGIFQAQATAFGSMPTGDVQLHLTLIDQFGTESGTAESATIVTVPDHGAIEIEMLASPPSYITRMAFYATTPNGSDFYLVAEVPANTGHVTIETIAGTLRLETTGYEALQPSSCLMYRHGVVFAAYDRIVRYSDPLRPFLTHPDNLWWFERPVQLMVPALDGLYVATDRETYFVRLTLINPEAPILTERTRVAGYGAIPGSATRIDGNDSLYAWLSPTGLCVGNPGGQITELTRDRLTLPAYVRAASAHRILPGARQAIFSCYE